ncbi:inactive hydroxysteroid dehydrogenase-like protein 1 [Anopheles bellator]|uniref:inactive hydroxysteroid dehydrogenase-like protein 1 n=1 Tax=Anopheles bellator TaxID=139047 RepID=UPI00264913A8|nr:inactive hydroxysteroid dehydrogenase-like protein 1 [Anopheles bellator]XP_058060321.1 inactive hydroxysteroid dehydrogenase-like protein 1 [Anopheles bellator]
MLLTFLTFIGICSFASWVYENFRTPVLLIYRGLTQGSGNNFPEKYGPWAVITGGSDGIGKGYAHYLARQGMKVLLIARNEAKLKKVSQEITEKYGVETKILVADFSKGEQIYHGLETELTTLDIGILVNNVGVINEKPIRLEAMDKKLLWSLINVNVAAATLLCSILIPAMKRKRRGLIVNISSLSALAPTPYLAVYAATKAYMTSFSLALRQELLSYGVECQTVSPGYVETNMTEYLTQPNAPKKHFTQQLVKVKDFLHYAGYTIGKVDITCGHFTHGIQTALLKILPDWLKLRVYTKMYTHLLHKFSH